MQINRNFTDAAPTWKWNLQWLTMPELLLKEFDIIQVYPHFSLQLIYNE